MCALKILPIEKIRQADAYTITHEPISSDGLMERAGTVCMEWIAKHTDVNTQVKIVCGMGNNGGDGLVVARLLHLCAFNCEVIVLRHTTNASNDFDINFKQLAELPGLVITDVFEDEGIELSPDDVVVDAIFGSGLSRPVSGFMADIIRQINNSGALVISIDIPSGLFADEPTNPKSAIVKADYTLTFQMPKLAFLMPENEIYTGNWKILDIGLHPGFLASCESNNYFIQKDDCRNLHRSRTKFAHKGNFGHALLIAGSTGKFGASVMAAGACLRSGVGLLTTHLPGDGFLIMQTAVPEAMVSIDREDSFVSELPGLDSYNAIGFGPGIGTESASQATLKLLIQQAGSPLVLDADALNILSENKTWLAFLPAGSILTPHPKEFERLAGKTATHFERLELLRAFAIRYKLFIILKGAYTATATPSGEIFFNSTGNPGMATGGSGDVLTGIILGLLASGYPQRDACILGTWLHGKAGDFAAKKLSQEAMLPGDIIQMMGKAFKSLG